MDAGGCVCMKLEFDEPTHAYTLDGKRVPSVTQVLDMLTDWQHVPISTLEAARDLGTKVHAAVHLFNRGELDLDALDPILLPYVNAWRDFLEWSGGTLIASETRVASPSYGFAGTLDTLLDRRGHTWLIDVKSGAIPLTVGPQTAAYEKALNRKVRRYCVALGADGTYGVRNYTSSTDWSIFVSCLNVWKWRAKNQ